MKTTKNTCSTCKYKEKCEDAKIQCCLLKENEHLIKVGSWKGPDRIHNIYKYIKDL